MSVTTVANVQIKLQTYITGPIFKISYRIRKHHISDNLISIYTASYIDMALTSPPLLISTVMEFLVPKLSKIYFHTYVNIIYNFRHTLKLNGSHWLPNNYVANPILSVAIYIHNN